MSYLDPRGLAFVFCVCSKCGSTSFLSSTWEALTGVSWPETAHFWPHDIDKWHTLAECGPNCQRAGDSKALGRRPDFQVWLTRDPIDRLVLAYHSKVQCCGARNRREPCYPDRNANFVPKMARLAGIPPQSCFFFDEYVEALATVNEKHLQANLNPHFMPQHLYCPITDSS